MAAPTRGATVTTQVNSTADFSYTPDSGSDTILVVFVFQEDVTVSSNDDRVTAITFNGSNLTVQADARFGPDSFDAANDCQIWTLPNPGTSAGTISITGGFADRFGIVATTIIGASSTIDTTAINTAPDSNTTITFSTTADETLVLAAVCGANDANYVIAEGSEITNDWPECTVQPLSTRGEVSYEAFTSAQTNITSDYTSVSGARTAHALVAFAAATGGGGGGGATPRSNPFSGAFSGAFRGPI